MNKFFNIAISAVSVFHQRHFSLNILAVSFSAPSLFLNWKIFHHMRKHEKVNLIFNIYADAMEGECSYYLAENWELTSNQTHNYTIYVYFHVNHVFLSQLMDLNNFVIFHLPILLSSSNMLLDVNVGVNFALKIFHLWPGNANKLSDNGSCTGLQYTPTIVKAIKIDCQHSMRWSSQSITGRDKFQQPVWRSLCTLMPMMIY